MGRSKFKGTITAVLVIVFAVFTFAAYRTLSGPVLPDVDGNEVNIVVNRGESTMEVAEKLSEAGLVRNARFAYYYARFHRAAIKAGTYHLHKAMNLSTILDILNAGTSEKIVVRIPEGFTVSKIAGVLEENGVCIAVDFVWEARNSEGFLFPDTYYLAKGMDASAVVALMKATFDERTADIPAIANAAESERKRLVTLASIVEREYRRAEEAPLIASVFTNRLNHNIGLYSCATIEYIITEILKLPHPDIITYDDLDIDSPYNTYRHAGLPPGPIANPGLVALKAAAAPADTAYYYFRVVDPATGTHHFSTDYDEHLDVGSLLYTKTVAGR